MAFVYTPGGRSGYGLPPLAEKGLAAEAEKKAQDALKKKQAEDAALLASYQTGSQGIYDTSKGAASGLLGTSKSDIEALYGKGYANLQNLVGQESEAAIQQSLRPIEGKLARQGLLGGPSGALNEALAGASERVRTAGIGRLADYQGQMTGALANVYGSTASQQANLEDVYGQRSQGLLSTSLQNALAGTSAGAGLTEKFATTGLEAALGTAGQKEVIGTQGAINAAEEARARREREIAQDVINVRANQEKADAAKQLQQRQVQWDSQAATYLNPRTRWAGNTYESQMAQAVKALGQRPV